MALGRGRLTFAEGILNQWEYLHHFIPSLELPSAGSKSISQPSETQKAPLKAQQR